MSEAGVTAAVQILTAVMVGGISIAVVMNAVEEALGGPE